MTPERVDYLGRLLPRFHLHIELAELAVHQFSITRSAIFSLLSPF
jgi:hypothetical protein